MINRKKILSMLLCILMILSIAPTVAFAEATNITRIDINFADSLTDALTYGEAQTKFTIDSTKNYTKGNIYFQQGATNDLGASNYVDTNLTAGLYTWALIEVNAKPGAGGRENPEYDFDKNNLNSIEVYVNNTKLDGAIVGNYNDYWNSVDVYIPVEVTEYVGAKYTVSYNSNGGTSVPSEEVAENGYANQPTNPTQTGKIFVGWYSDEELTQAFSFAFTKIKKDTTLYAKWIDQVVAKNITRIDVNFDDTLTDALTYGEAQTKFTIDSTENYRKNNVYFKQGATNDLGASNYVYTNLTAGLYTWALIEVNAKYGATGRENPEYDFDKDNLNSIEVYVNDTKIDGAIVGNYNEYWKSVDVYFPVTVAESYTVKIDGVAQTVSGSEFTFPASTAKGFIAYTDGTNYYDAGSKVTVDKNLEFTTVAIGEVKMLKGASIRLSEKSGIRFETQVDTTALASLPTDAVVEKGTLITLKELATDELTLNSTFKTVNVKYLSNEYYKNANTFAGSIVSIKEANIAKEFIGRGYVKVTVGDITKTIYADYAENNIANNTRSVAFVANAYKTEAPDLYNSLDGTYKELVNKWASKIS